MHRKTHEEKKTTLDIYCESFGIDIEETLKVGLDEISFKSLFPLFKQMSYMT